MGKHGNVERMLRGPAKKCYSNDGLYKGRTDLEFERKLQAQTKPRPVETILNERREALSRKDYVKAHKLLLELQNLAKRKDDGSTSED
jgi:hypothetical protein